MCPANDCVLACGPEKTCYPNTCCAVQKKSASPSRSETGVSSPVNSTVATRRSQSAENTV